MIQSALLGYPRLGKNRELKRACEKFWQGGISQNELEAVGRQLRHSHWQQMAHAQIDYIPSNDFSFYDHVLDTTAMVGAVPARYGWQGGRVDYDTYFAMARGVQSHGRDIPAMEMTKWFDTNYHYIVPEFVADQSFTLASTKAVDEYLEAKALGIDTRPCLLGPVSYLLLGKSVDKSFDPLQILPRLLPVYQTVLQQLAAAGATSVQIDEPTLVLDLSAAAQTAFETAYQALTAVAGPQLVLTSYFGSLGDNAALALRLPTAVLHVDLVRAAQQLGPLLAQWPTGKRLQLGVVDGRNVWRTDLDQALQLIDTAVAALGAEQIIVAPSCSFLFCPYDLALETEIEPEIRAWLAFAEQKIDEIAILQQAANGQDVAELLAQNRHILAQRRQSERTHNTAVRQRLADITPEMLRRAHPHAQRKAAQAAHLRLPAFPTTTIGSFPQTAVVRAKRAAYRQGKLSQEAYHDFLKAEIAQTVRLQEEIGLDVLVHGEAERTDMVEYFAQQLTGFAFTQHGWVQSYGSRAVRPPILYGDVTRPAPMTVDWSVYAQSLTAKPMKGMLTGPVTILQWSFVRDDQPEADSCRQIALAIRDEVADLEAHNIRVIQIDEPAIREGLPLRRADWPAYLQWAVECFRLASTAVADQTQIHTHMCYAEFNDMIEAIAQMDADVISIEASRSRMELLEAFVRYAYPNDIGPGVYDIHSPRVPQQAEMEKLLQEALAVVPASQLWVNPDCGLKTRRWEEVQPALVGMVAAAKRLRQLG